MLVKFNFNLSDHKSSGILNAAVVVVTHLTGRLIWGPVTGKNKIFFSLIALQQ